MQFFSKDQKKWRRNNFWLERDLGMIRSEEKRGKEIRRGAEKYHLSSYGGEGGRGKRGS